MQAPPRPREATSLGSTNLRAEIDGDDEESMKDERVKT